MPPVKKKSGRRIKLAVAPAARIEAGFWKTWVLPRLKARAPVLGLVLVAVGTLRIVAAYPVNGITFDEPGHMACGLQFLAQHVYRYESQHPPLARVMAALGPYLDGARPHGGPQQDLEGLAILYRNTHVLRTLVLMRLGVLPFFWLASLVVYLLAIRWFGRPAAALAVGLFTLLPPVLAHAGLATTDMAVTACVGLAYLSLIGWAERPSIGRSLGFGAATGLMVLSKFTALAFFPAAALLALAAYLATGRPTLAQCATLAKQRALPFTLAVLTGAAVVWAGYLFSFGKVPGWGVALPAPEVFDGVRSALLHNEHGHPAYLLGQRSSTGWWYYFPVVLAVKTPLAFLLLLMGGAWVCWQKRRDSVHWLPWALSLGTLIPAMMGNVNIGVRHILPVYLGFSIAAALALERLLESTRLRKWAGAILAIWLAGSSLRSHPDYLAYFNELAGTQPEKILVDSDLDWGQETVPLARWMKDRGVSEINFVTMNLNSKQLAVWPGIPNDHRIEALVPAEGWTAVSPTMLNYYEYGLDHQDPNLKPWFEYLAPVGRVGTLILYYVPPGALSQHSGHANPSDR